MKRPLRCVFVCGNLRPPGHPRGSCGAKGGADVRQAFKAELERRGLHGRIRAVPSGCFDLCEEGPVVLVHPDDVWYRGVTMADVPAIVSDHLEGGTPVVRLRLPEEDPPR